MYYLVVFALQLFCLTAQCEQLTVSILQLPVSVTVITCTHTHLNSICILLLCSGH